jgi:light-harvesting protein B-800-850 alpha chain
MNQGRIWCVVNPTVGLPLFLGSVALTSLIVHYSVLSNTTWFAAFLNGHAKPKAAAMEQANPPVAASAQGGAPGFVISVAPTAGNAARGETAFVVSVAPQQGASPPTNVVAATETTRLPQLASAAPVPK